MLRLTKRQQELAADKLADLANLAAAALVFGQAIGGAVLNWLSAAMAFAGVALWLLLMLLALGVAKEAKR